jgi:hypothetical protein
VQQATYYTYYYLLLKRIELRGYNARIRSPVLEVRFFQYLLVASSLFAYSPLARHEAFAVQGSGSGTKKIIVSTA